MTPATFLQPVLPEAALAPSLDVVVPVHNEEGDLAASVRRLVAHLQGGFPFSARVTIADNASTDDTWAVAQGLLVFAAALVLTSGALAAVHALSDPSRATEVVALVAANLAATVLRFLALRGWVFRPRPVSRSLA